MYLHRDKKSGIYKYRREYPIDISAAVGKKWFVNTTDEKTLEAANEKYSEIEDIYQSIINEHKISQYVISSDVQKRLLQLLKIYRVRPIVERSNTISYTELLAAQKYALSQIGLIYKKIALEGEDASIFAILGLHNNASAKTALLVWKNIFLQIENALRDARSGSSA